MIPLKALSVRQPWAQLIVEGIKDIENRTWRTSYRGRILIHAPAKIEKQIPSLFMTRFTDLSIWPELHFPTSAIIGSVEIVACIRDSRSGWAEHGLWHWVLDNPIHFENPIRNVKGKLGIFAISDPDILGRIPA